jgi:hypothetical protein
MFQIRQFPDVVAVRPGENDGAELLVHLPLADILEGRDACDPVLRLEFDVIAGIGQDEIEHPAFQSFVHAVQIER